MRKHYSEVAAMRKQYSQYGSRAGSILRPADIDHAVVQVSKNTYVYRGFTIRKTPRNALNNRNTYLINKRDQECEVDNYFGRDFALAEACSTINRILKHGRLIS